MHKAILVVMDGLGDRPLRELGGLTPLEAAHTPNLDALAAKDRPYKAAVPVDRALMILEEEARINLLDANLLQIFVEAKVFERTMARIF